MGDDFVLHRRIGFVLLPAFDIQLFPVVGKFDRDFPYPVFIESAPSFSVKSIVSSFPVIRLFNLGSNCLFLF